MTPKPRLSFEVFPPKTSAGLTKLGAAVNELAAANPTYVSVTYGAGGSSRDRSFAAIDAVHRQGLEVAAHLTCVGQSKREIEAIIERYEALGVTHIVALRGDPPAGIDAPYTPHPDGFTSTAELVAAIKARGDYRVSVSAYPEIHPQSTDLDHDLEVLTAKIDAGANAAMTQMFFDNDHFARYLEAIHQRGIDIPIVPGVFPIHSFDGVARFAARCGASIPNSITQRFADLTDEQAAFELAVEVAVEQIDGLVALGIDHVHIYTLNQAPLALAVAERVGTAAI